jgi:hypothetical protein
MSLPAIDRAAIQNLQQRLLQSFDANKDNQLSQAEFSNLLGNLLGTGLVNMASTPGAPPAAEPPRLEGFNPDKLATGDSPKYRFARAAMQYSLSGVRDKEGAEALLREMQPAFEREGLDVLGIDKDRIKIRYENQEIWVDVMRAASTGAQAFQWLPL